MKTFTLTLLSGIAAGTMLTSAALAQMASPPPTIEPPLTGCVWSEISCDVEVSVNSTPANELYDCTIYGYYTAVPDARAVLYGPEDYTMGTSVSQAQSYCQEKAQSFAVDNECDITVQPCRGIQPGAAQPPTLH